MQHVTSRRKVEGQVRPRGKYSSSIIVRPLEERRTAVKKERSKEDIIELTTTMILVWQKASVIVTLFCAMVRVFKCQLDG